MRTSPRWKIVLDAATLAELDPLGDLVVGDRYASN